MLLGGIFSSAVMSSFRYLRHASHWLPLMGGEGGEGGGGGGGEGATHDLLGMSLDLSVPRRKALSTW